MDDGTKSDGSPQASGGRPGEPTALPKDPAAIEAIIAQRRADLASTIDELMVRAHPKVLARKTADDLRAKARDFAFTADGAPRVERLAAVGAAVIALVGLLVLQRRRGSAAE